LLLAAQKHLTAVWRGRLAPSAGLPTCLDGLRVLSPSSVSEEDSDTVGVWTTRQTTSSRDLEARRWPL